jgi:T5SS/PEP-CTERM-associated repeat protein
MKRCYVGLGLLLFFMPRAAEAALITAAQAFARSYYSGSQSPGNLINNSGLNTASGNVLTYTHASDGSANGMWHAGQGQGTGGGAPNVASQYLVFNLGASYDLTSAYLWQMIQPGLLGRGIKDFELYASPNAPNPAHAANPPATYDLTGFTQILGPTTLAQASGSSTPTQPFSLNSATNVRQVYLKINNAWSGLANDYVGLAEIKFDGTLIPPTNYHWMNAAGGSWQVAGNWSPATGPPSGTNDVTFALTDTYTVTSASDTAVTNMNVSAGNARLTLGTTALQATTLNLSGGKLSVPSFVFGSAAAGQMGASTVNWTNGSLEIVGGTYKPTVGTLTSNTPTPVSRTGSWGISGASGTSNKPTLELSGGATASNPATNVQGSIIFGINGGKGGVRVSDVGSLLSTTQTVTSQNNSINVGLGGTMIAGNFVRSEGTVDVANQGMVSGRSHVVIGLDGAKGTATVDNATLRSTNSWVWVGYNRYSADADRESQGSLAVTNAGTVTGAGGVIIGGNGGAGVATVDGAGSTLRATNNSLWVGGFRYANASGPSGNGKLTLTNGAYAAGTNVNIGTEGGVGEVNVQSGATLATSFGHLLVGWNSTGTNLPGQGTLNATDGGIVSVNGATFIGTDGGGVGFATISGAGSTLTSYGIRVGALGAGTLDIKNGGIVNADGGMDLGITGPAYTIDTTGLVRVDGVDSMLKVYNGDLLIGTCLNANGLPAKGTLDVTNGGRVSSLAHIKVAGVGGKGEVTVGKSDGSDTAVSTLSAVGNLVIGTDGSSGAKLTVYAKGVVEVGGNLGVVPQLTPPANPIDVSLAGGAIKTSTTSFADAAYFNWTSGTLWYTSGPSSDSGVGADENATLTVPVGGLLKGSTNLKAQLAVNGSVSPGDSDTAQFNAGNLSIGTANMQGEFAADVDFANNAADLLAITGSVDLTNAKLGLSLLAPPPGSLPTPLTFLLIANDGLDAVTGTFAEIDLGMYSSARYIVNYAFSGAALNGAGTGNDVAITFYAVPEPSTLVMTFLAATGVLVRRRRSVV